MKKSKITNVNQLPLKKVCYMITDLELEEKGVSLEEYYGDNIEAIYYMESALKHGRRKKVVNKYYVYLKGDSNE